MADDAKARAEEIRETNDRVWYMVLYHVNPVFIYVGGQIALLSLTNGHPDVRRFEALLYVGQFLGAWSVFYSVLLKDMGFRNYAAQFLTILAIGALTVQYFFLPPAIEATSASIFRFWAIQMVPAVIAWVLTMIQWRRLKKRWLPEIESEAGQR